MHARLTDQVTSGRQGAGPNVRRFRRAWSVLGAAALAVPMALIPVTIAHAAEWGISKQEMSTGPYEPGENVQWIVTASCSDPTDPCVPTTITDPLPDGVLLVSASVQSDPGATNGNLDVDTGANTVTYTADSVQNGTQVQILIVAQIDPDLPFSQSGVPITNTATVDSDNADEASASDDIIPIVELDLDSETTKSIDPDGALAAPGTPATMTIGATNTSNDPVDQLVIQDPVDPTADPNPFDLLEFTGTGDITMPPNADTVTEEYWDGSQWLPLDDTVDPSAVQGVRYTFSGDIQPGSTATIPVEVQQSDAVEELTEATTVTNDVSSYVVHGDEQSDPTTASDTYVITPPDNSVEASKSFDPDTVSAGDPTTVTIGGTNTGTPVTSMTITEPAPGTDSPFEGDNPLTFTGFGPAGDGTGVTWPANADAASVVFTCADGSTPSEETATVGTLPNPPADCDVIGFEIQFTGDIVTGGEASIPFTADTDPDQEADDLTHTNTVEATVPSAEPDTASADLVTLVDRLATETEKIISPSEIPAVPGQSVVVQLPSQLLPFGPDGSTTNADQVVIQDPTDPSDPEEFWANFTATSVRTTDVPANATLTINYWDGNAWVQAPDCGPFDGPATVSCDLPDGAQGVQFVYDSTDDGFPPGTQFQPNFTAAYDGPADRDTPIANCGASSASSSTIDPTDPAVGCDAVTPFPVDPGALGLIDKAFLGDAPVSVLARSDEQVTAQITWSTSGFVGVDSMVISDIADPETTDIGDSFYDAFNLVSVDAIDSSVDPLMQYDQIDSVELFIDGSWVTASGNPCPCDGSFPGYTLTADEQASATNVRLT
jgi:large repetitive protein